EFRIGINLGDVMVEGGDLYGEGVNVAARLEALAEPGGICISRTVYDQVRTRLTLAFDFIGEQAVKNISEPVPVYRVQLDGAAQGGAQARRIAPAADLVDRPLPGHAERVGAFRRRAIRAGGLVAFLCVINMLTEPEYWWFLWPASLLAAFLAWDALKVYYPGLAYDHEWQKIGGDATFSKDTRFRGRIGGNVVVARGVHLELTGNVGGNLTIERDAVAEVHGKIGGHVVNRGGTLRLSGKLDGELREEKAAGPPADAVGEHEQPHRS
ncbi:MAG TPA: 2TM domain-containing protein, partial [Geminicoccaceae bacterium]|nr:2TM domain-containing protein [Geminicoccaceae bacterium]